MKVSATPVVMLALLAWNCLMFMPYTGIRSWEQLVSLNSSSPVVYQAAGVLAFCGTAFLFWRGSYLNSLRFSSIQAHHRLFLLFCGYTLLSAPLSVSPVDSALFSCIHLAVFSAMVRLWRSGRDMERHLALFSVGIFAFIAVLYVVLGVRLRSLGFIPPNDLAKLAFVAMAFGMFGRRRTRIATTLLGVGVILFCQSRGTLVASALFFALLLFSTRNLVLKVGLLSAMAFAASFIFLIDHMLRGPLWAWIEQRVLLLDDLTRGTESGLTGRTEYWERAIDLFWRNPVVGYGLRTRETTFTTNEVALNAHSGFINMLLDVGIIGSALLLPALLICVYKGLRTPNLSSASTNDFVAWRPKIGPAFIGASFVLFAIEPVYINIGTQLSVAVLLFLAAPSPQQETTKPSAARITVNHLGGRFGAEWSPPRIQQ
ncbi:O-antigen ligase family protein [Devosia sp. MC521]|uniref:O-antigen ligase family protein n=1 Tax=Devosia sp. MC521 TaxID=2759954 RepID=UPI0015FB6841|nr:O-antigen ligase family protein [Devosia sp. MC521]MBJ6989203.1 O-antigen ligase family protein [Devosia sp. MC521]QMW63296.1 O-antigen ligase family protein [Devosia sp. MC521]